MLDTNSVPALMSTVSDPNQLFSSIRKKYYNANRVHPGINRFLASLGLDIKVYKVRGTSHYAVQFPYMDGYQYYTSSYPDYAVDRAIEIAIKSLHV